MLMEGNEPVDHLPRMYHALQRYAGSFDRCEDQMQEDCDAMEDCNGKKFEEIRERVVMSMEEHMVETKSVLFEHGAYDGGEGVADDQTRRRARTRILRLGSVSSQSIISQTAARCAVRLSRKL